MNPSDPGRAREIQFPFDEQKATEAAAHLIKIHGGPIGRLRLLKLLYLADREAIRQHNWPICGGRYVSMPHGPVVSEVLDLIKADILGGPGQIWNAHLYSVGRNVALKTEPAPAAMSDGEMQILDKVYGEMSRLGDGAIRAFAHRLPEFEDPGRSSRLIPAERILRNFGRTDEQIQDTRDEVEFQAFLRSALAL